jgi:phosphoribosylformimino-5-aminoimidazole carboxamide ribotide isomerase
MTLDRVGSDGGPDIERLQDIIRRAGSRRIYAAGGIRDRADLDRVRAAGAAGALIASALHARKISAGDLKEIAGR